MSAGVHGWINMSLLPPALQKVPPRPAQCDSKKPDVCPSHHQLPRDRLFAFTLQTFLCCEASGKRLL